MKTSYTFEETDIQRGAKFWIGGPFNAVNRRGIYTIVELSDNVFILVDDSHTVRKHDIDRSPQTWNVIGMINFLNEMKCEPRSE